MVLKKSGARRLCESFERNEANSTGSVIMEAEKKHRAFGLGMLISFPWSNVFDILIR